jgi:hypothetical protein
MKVSLEHRMRSALYFKDLDSIVTNGVVYFLLLCNMSNNGGIVNK